MKLAQSCAEALGEISKGATILVGGFGEAGSPTDLLEALCRADADELTVVSNNAGNGATGLAALVATGKVARLICSYPRSADGHAFLERWQRSDIELELVPQGTLAERIRAGGAGIPAFYTPTGVGTLLAQGRELRRFGSRTYVLEQAIRADIALIRACCADRAGNLLYQKAARNFNPVMATAADRTVAQCDALLESGFHDPEAVITPGIFVDCVVVVTAPIDEAALLRAARKR